MYECVLEEKHDRKNNEYVIFVFFKLMVMDFNVDLDKDHLFGSGLLGAGAGI